MPQSNLYDDECSVVQSKPFNERVRVYFTLVHLIALEMFITNKNPVDTSMIQSCLENYGTSRKCRHYENLL